VSNHAFAAVEACLVNLVVFEPAIWQFVSVKRSIQRDRETTGHHESFGS
jgi:hypothetical protein